MRGISRPKSDYHLLKKKNFQRVNKNKVTSIESVISYFELYSNYIRSIWELGEGRAGGRGGKVRRSFNTYIDETRELIQLCPCKRDRFFPCTFLCTLAIYTAWSRRVPRPGFRAGLTELASGSSFYLCLSKNNLTTNTVCRMIKRQLIDGNSSATDNFKRSLHSSLAAYSTWLTESLTPLHLIFMVPCIMYQFL